MAQYDPENPGNVLILPQLTQPTGYLRPSPTPQTGVEYPSDTTGCGFCQCLYEDETGWWFPFTGSTGCAASDDVTGDGRNLEQLCADEMRGNQLFGTAIPVWGIGSPIPYVPAWASPELVAIPTQATGNWTIACGDTEIDVQLQQQCDPVFERNRNGNCVPIAIPPPPGPCPRACPPDINGNCHCDPPLPLASDGNGFASPVGPFALPVHPVLSAASLVSCGACQIGPGEGEEAEL